MDSNVILTDLKILTITEVAEFLRVHRSTVSRYAMSGELKSRILGNRRLFKESDVCLFFDNLEDKSFASIKEE